MRIRIVISLMLTLLLLSISGTSSAEAANGPVCAKSDRNGNCSVTGGTPPQDASDGMKNRTVGGKPMPPPTAAAWAVFRSATYYGRGS